MTADHFHIGMHNTDSTPGPVQHCFYIWKCTTLFSHTHLYNTALTPGSGHNCFTPRHVQHCPLKLVIGYTSLPYHGGTYEYRATPQYPTIGTQNSTGLHLTALSWGLIRVHGYTSLPYHGGKYKYRATPHYPTIGAHMSTGLHLTALP